MEDYILISQLNDFIFCPYSIYLHNIYSETTEEIYHAAPQTRGRIAHETVEQKTATHNKDTLLSLPIMSEEYGLMGKIDVYHADRKTLIERKFRLRSIFQGQIYQLWAQMFCMQEMGYKVEHLAFYEISTNRTISIDLPTETDKQQFANFLQRFRNYRPEETIHTNPNKCSHCIYNNLCEKIDTENVYQ